MQWKGEPKNKTSVKIDGANQTMDMVVVVAVVMEYIVEGRLGI
jgi:hypothetical protein